MDKYNIRSFDPSKQPGFYDPVMFFLPEGPLCVEIGCGVGMHPIKFAKKNPKKSIVAIEHTRNKFEAFKVHLQEESEVLENLQPIHANAITWISKFLPEESVDEYFLLYPNPWPKEKQKNQRWHQMPFVHQIKKTMKKEARLTLATNMDWYAEEASEFFQKAWGFHLESFEHIGITDNDDYFPRTHFEKKYLERGERCSNLVLRKN